MLFKIVANLVLLFFSLSCFGQGLPDISERKRLHVKYINSPDTVFDIQRLPICSNYGCKQITNIEINSAQWQKILSYFGTSIRSAESERKLLKQVIAHIEEIVGEKTNTQFDLGGTFTIYRKFKNAKSEQMDCVDESTNTLLYLRLLSQYEKLKYHEVLGVRSRGGLRAGYPHTAVLLKDIISKEKYIIDSWFHDNGKPAEVVPLKKWKRGWKPD